MNSISRTLSVVGARGFIGRHLLTSEVAPPDYIYHLLSRRKGDLIKIRPKCKTFSGDLREPYIEDGFIVPDATVVNFAYLEGDNITENLAALDFLVEQCISARAQLLIHCSTAVVVGDANDKVVDENTICNPVTKYERCKLAMERYLIEKCRDRIRLAILRPTAIFGKGGKNMNTIIDFATRKGQLKKKLRLSVFDTRHMNLISIENVAAAIHFIAAQEHKPGHGRYIISNDDQPLNTFGGVYRLICEVMKIHVPEIAPIPFKGFLQKAILRSIHGPSVLPDRSYCGQRLADAGFQFPFAFDDSVRRYVRERKQLNMEI